MKDTCEFHDQIMKDNAMALEGKIAKSSLKWIAAIFALPVIGAILAAYAFIVTADYRYGTSQQAQQNAANITILAERTSGIKAEMGEIKFELRSLNRKLSKDHEGGSE